MSVRDTDKQINDYYYQLMYSSPQDWAYLWIYHRLKQGAITRAIAQGTVA